eukprot:1249570-Amorphochlora_amoeboformis.AAC.1
MRESERKEKHDERVRRKRGEESVYGRYGHQKQIGKAERERGKKEKKERSGGFVTIRWFEDECYSARSSVREAFGYALSR